MNNAKHSTYRVRSTRIIGDHTNDAVTVWEGDDINALSVKYPPSDIWGADALSHHEIEGGHIRTDFQFEQFRDGEWQQVNDPRVRLTPVTDMEREIDLQNRRDFPGDYITDNDEIEEES